MAITVRLNGIDRTSNVAIDSLNISWTANLESFAELSFYDSAPAVFRPIVGQPIEIFDGSTRIYWGLIHEFNEVKRPGAARLIYDCTCRDYSCAFDHHLVAQVYDNRTLKYIVEDIIETYVHGHGLTTTGVQTGPTITKAIFNYMTVKAAFSELSELTGYTWWIDENKNVNFAARESIISPSSITPLNALPNVTINRTISNYRNIQYVRAGHDITSLQTENFKGDSARRVFNVAFAVAMVPTITVDSVPKTVGIRGLDSGKDFYWSKGVTEISQDSSGVLLTSSNTLQVQYQGLFPIIVRSEDSAAIAERVGIESTSGHYESMETAEYIENVDLAMDKASGLLRRYAIIPMTINLSTRQAGLRAGQLLRITLADHGIDGDYLIDRVRAQYEPGRDAFVYSVSALNGDSVNGWVEFFKKLADAGKTFVIRENEVLVRLLYFTETLSFTDSIAANSAAYACAIVDISEVGYAETC